MFVHYLLNLPPNNKCCCKFAGARAPTPELEDNPRISPDLDTPESPQSPPALPPPSSTGRRKADAAVTAIHPGLVLTKISGRVSSAMWSTVNDVSRRFQVPDGEMAAGVVSEEFRAGMKRQAEKITRSQCEIYSFSEKYNLPLAAVDELIASVGNVSIYSHY